MSLNQKIKSQILNFIKQPIPQDIDIVKKSIPVPFFGNIEKARVATISINPSNKEFEDKNHKTLIKSKKRFSDREILNATDNDVLNDEQRLTVFDSLINYFNQKNNNYYHPYKTWFNWLDRYVGDMFGCSYYDGTMVNLDIYPWATAIKWGNIDPKTKDNILKQYSLLKDILLDKEALFDYVYINGATVKNQIEKYLGVTIPEYSCGQLSIYNYKMPNGIILVGSSCYIQNSHKTSEELKNLHAIIKSSIK